MPTTENDIREAAIEAAIKSTLFCLDDLRAALEVEQVNSTRRHFRKQREEPWSTWEERQRAHAMHEIHHGPDGRAIDDDCEGCFPAGPACPLCPQEDEGTERFRRALGKYRASVLDGTDSDVADDLAAVVALFEEAQDTVQT